MFIWSIAIGVVRIAAQTGATPHWPDDQQQLWKASFPAVCNALKVSFSFFDAFLLPSTLCFFFSSIHPSLHQQKTKVNGAISEPKTVTCGVPQGSTLGPLSFIAYINYLPSVLNHTKCLLYADDTAIYCSHQSTSQLTEFLKEDLEVEKWLNTNKLFLNVK